MEANDPTRPRGILSVSDREYLLDNSTNKTSQRARNTRSRIRERTTNSILDYTILFEQLEERDFEQVFSVDDPELNTDFQSGLEDAVAFLYRGLQASGTGVEAALDAAICKAEEKDDRFAEVEISIETRPLMMKHERVEALVERYQNEDEELLWILHAIVNRLPPYKLESTVELLLGESSVPKIERVQEDIDVEGLTPIYERIEDGDGDEVPIYEVVAKAIAESEADLAGKLSERLSTATTGVRDAWHILGGFAGLQDIDPPLSIDRKGFERTSEIYSDSDLDVDDLVSFGMVYEGKHKTNAYLYQTLVVPDYALDLIADGAYLYRRNRSDVLDRLQEAETREFLRWMGGPTRRVTRSKEEQEIRDRLEEKGIALDWNSFRMVRDELIQSGLLVIAHSSGRRAKSGRGATRNKWVYKLTDQARGVFSDLLFEELA